MTFRPWCGLIAPCVTTMFPAVTTATNRGYARSRLTRTSTVPPPQVSNAVATGVP
jgi:hypothetical protein